MIQRPQYLENLKQLKDTRLIKVITGIRRCGKSTLMDLYRTYLIESGIEQSQIISINFEDMNNAHLLDAVTLHTYVRDRLISDHMYYIFLDEVQNVPQFPNVLDSLYIQPNVDLYVTGSNAFLLSSELATLLSGRYVEIQMLPLSFKEYVTAVAPGGSLRRKYNDYVRYSSFPYALSLQDRPEVLNQYLQGIYSTVVLKDVLAKNAISDVLLLESLIKFIFDSVGNLISPKKIADTLNAHGRKTSSPTVEKYLSALVDSYILYRVHRFDVKGRDYLKTLEKYYCVDIGLRYLLLGSQAGDSGHILENVIYLELLRRGYTVYVGKTPTSEIDFVTRDSQGSFAYYQVSYTVQEQRTLERELAPLLGVDDHYPKFLITLDEENESDYKGIRIINALDFLLS